MLIADKYLNVERMHDISLGFISIIGRKNIDDLSKLPVVCFS